MKDAKDALALDSSYSKAYARMGFAYLNMNKLPEAEDAYSNALRLDPSNQSYKDNLEAVREKINAGPTNVMSQRELLNPLYELHMYDGYYSINKKHR